MRKRQTESADEFIERKSIEFEKKKPILMKDISRKGHHHFIRTNWTFMKQHNLKEKVFLIERLERTNISGESDYGKGLKVGDIEYRIGYFIVGKHGRKKDKWTWGQFCAVIPIDDFDVLFEKAKREGTIL